MAACERAGVVPGILHRINLTARGKGSIDARGVSVRDQLGGSPEATRLDPAEPGGEEGEPGLLEGQDRINMRWVVEEAFSIFKRVFGEHVMALKWENIVQEIRFKVGPYTTSEGTSR